MKQKDILIEERIEGEPFTIHGARFERCSGEVISIDFDLLEKGKDELKIFPDKKNSISKIKLELEDAFSTQGNPIKYHGCKGLKIHYLFEPKEIYHYILI